MQAVRFDRYGGVDVLRLVDVPAPVPEPGEALVRVRAAGINPGEMAIREGALHHLWPATFPSGQGTDLAGVVERLGADVEGLAVGDEVLGFTEARASHAELVAVPAGQLAARPADVPWPVAGALFVAGATAYAAVRAVAAAAGDTVVVSAAAGGVGSVASQLARRTGARVIGLAGEANHAWLAAHDITPVAYGDGVGERIRAAAGDGVDAFIDTFGGGYVDLAIELGVRPERIDTIIDFEAAERHGTKSDGSIEASPASVLAELAGLIADGQLELPIARVYPLAEVHDAFRELAERHTHGKIVLQP